MKYRVLICDDQIMPRQLFEGIINSSDKYILSASIDSAQLADLYCAKDQIDLIIMDIVMSDGVSGLDVAAKIKTTYPNIKIIVVTSMPDSTFLVKAKEAGVDSFWYKEVQDAPMLDIMDRTMAGENVYPDSSPIVQLGMIDNTGLTARELDVLRMLASGLTDKEIADELGISYHTARFHLNSLLQKTGYSTRTELAIKAVMQGIVVPGF